MESFRQWRAHYPFRPCRPDVARSTAAGGSMIRHAPEAAAFPVSPLPVPVIEPSFPTLLVSPLGAPLLLASHPASAPIPAVGLPPVAGTTDVEHRPATRPSARQLVPHHFLGHRTPHDSIAACEPCRVGGDAWGLDLGLGGVGEWAERIGGGSVAIILGKDHKSTGICDPDGSVVRSVSRRHF